MSAATTAVSTAVKRAGLMAVKMVARTAVSMVEM